MSTTAHRFAALLTVVSTAALAPAQIPQGWYVYGAFSPSRGPIGVFASHPRNPGAPTAIKNLQGDLTVTGSSCILYRQSDGAILVGERAPTNSSVDVHMIMLNKTSVLFDASFSVGTGGPCCGEIPQMGLLPDGRVVVAATDLSAGPLKNYLTTSYGWQGVGIVDTHSGLITPIVISNGAQIVDVFNGLAISPDAQSVYLGTYVSGTQGDLWRVPITGGTATLIGSVPAGLSNLAFDGSGDLWVTTLDANQGLFRVDVTTGTATQVPQTNGSLNAITLDPVTANFAALSANAGIPPRSVFWMEPNGTAHMLTSPGFGSLSGIAIVPNLVAFGSGTPGTAEYRWQMPNPGGLPVLGNSGFSLTLEATGAPLPGWAVIATAPAASPVTILGAAIHVDLATILTSFALPFPGPMTLPLAIPNDGSLIGLSLCVQSLHIEGPTQLSASPAIGFTIL